MGCLKAPFFGNPVCNPGASSQPYLHRANEVSLSLQVSSVTKWFRRQILQCKAKIGFCKSLLRPCCAGRGQQQPSRGSCQTRAQDQRRFLHVAPEVSDHLGHVCASSYNSGARSVVLRSRKLPVVLLLGCYSASVRHTLQKPGPKPNSCVSFFLEPDLRFS